MKTSPSATEPFSTESPAGSTESAAPEYSAVSPNTIESVAPSVASKATTPKASASVSLAPERLPVEEVRVSMGRVITAWGFGSVFINLTAGAVYVAFATELGASDFIFGVLASAVPLMSFLQVLAARLVERSGRRKRQLLIAGVVSRSLWIITALLPLFALLFPHLISKRQVLPLVIASVLLSGVGYAFSAPAFFSWMADLIPQRVRATFFARRTLVGTWLALTAAIVSGWIADEFPHLAVYSGILALAGIAGLMETLLFLGVREPPAVEENDEPLPPFWASLREPLHDRAIRSFLLFTALLMFSAGLLGPFMWRHALYNLKLSKIVTGLILNVAPYLGVAWTSRFWGDFIKRYGNRPVLRLASAGLILVPTGWLAADPASAGFWESAGTLFALTFCAASLAGGLEIVNHNWITSLSPHIPRSTMTAVFFIAAGLSLAAGSWIGGAFAEWLGPAKYSFLGFKLVNYHFLFLCALALRLFNATFVAAHLKEPAARKTTETVKEVVPELFQSFQSFAARFTRPFGVR